MARNYDTSCDICRHAVEHNWFGLQAGMSHCPRQLEDDSWCHATWSGFSVIHCVGCHRTFSSPSALDRHKTANNACVDPATVTTKGGRPYFGEPFVNQFGTTIWRQAGDSRPTFQET